MNDIFGHCHGGGVKRIATWEKIAYSEAKKDS
jgi:hypothetical protein